MSNLMPMPATIVGIQYLTDKERLFTIKLDNGKGIKHRPCQFVMVSLQGIGEAPISISSPPPLDSDDTFELCIRSVGNLTGAIHRLSVFDKIGIRGPYGNGFPVEKLDDKDILIIAGGLGLAPLRSLIKYILRQRWRYGRVVLLFGFKRPEYMLFTDEISEWEVDPSLKTYITVDVAGRPWRKNVGVITDLFKYVDIDPYKTIAVIAGPPVMYRFVIRELLTKNIFEWNIFIDLERRMRCGIGKCGHCQINGIYLCQNGPILSYIEAKKLQEAL